MFPHVFMKDTTKMDNAPILALSSRMAVHMLSLHGGYDDPLLNPIMFFSQK